MDKPITALSYGFLTPYFDYFSNLFGYGNKQKEKILDLLKLKRNERLLDIGCGTGSLLIIAKKKYPNLDLTGIDADRMVLTIAKNKVQKSNLNIKLIESSANKLPFKDSSFDVIVSTLVFHHLPTEVKKGALKEIHRILKRNGKFLLVDIGRINFPIKIFYCLLVILRIPEAKTLKDNVDGKIPEFLKQADFNFREIAPKYKGIIYYFLAKKKSK